MTDLNKLLKRGVTRTEISRECELELEQVDEAIAWLASKQLCIDSGQRRDGEVVWHVAKLPEGTNYDHALDAAAAGEQ